LPQLLEFGVVNFTRLLEQGFRLLQQLAQPIGAGVTALQNAFLLVDVLHLLLEPFFQSPNLGILSGAKLRPGCWRFVGGVLDRRVEFGAGFGLVA
jgi:hypothetical protein